MNGKLKSYLGFAKKSGNLVTGTNTCSFNMKKQKVKLLLIAEDVSRNTLKKILNEARSQKTPYRIHGMSDDLSHATGTSGRSVFGIMDENFANVIIGEIDAGQKSEKEVIQ